MKPPANPYLVVISGSAMGVLQKDPIFQSVRAGIGREAADGRLVFDKGALLAVLVRFPVRWNPIGPQGRLWAVRRDPPSFLRNTRKCRHLDQRGAWPGLEAAGAAACFSKDDHTVAGQGK